MTKTTSNSKPNTNKIGRNLAIGVCVGAVLVVLVAFVLSVGTPNRDASFTCGSDRTVIVGLASANRSPTAVQANIDIITAHTLAAKICDEELRIVGVAGGTQVLVNPVDPIGDLDGPNSRARAGKVASAETAVFEAVASALDDIYAAYPDVATTSLPALYQAAADHSAETGRVVLLTTGVHDEADLSLNRPLESGEGSRLADTITWPILAPDATVVIIGIAQMDEATPVPGGLWPAEVKAFNEVACDATGATCTMYQVAETTEALV